MHRHTCCAAKVGELLDVRELADADAAPRAQCEHGGRQPGALPPALVPEGAVALDHRRGWHQRSFRLARCRTATSLR